MLSLSRRALATSTALTSAVALAACGSGSSSTSGHNGGQQRITVSFYPLEFAVQQIGGDRVKVSNLTKPGAEPHDLDLTPRQVADLTKADLTVYVKGFQHSVDQAITANGATHTLLDTAPQAKLDLTTSDTESVGDDDGEHEDEASARDPHFWLDPVRYKAVVQAIGARMAKDDPAGRTTYEANTRSLVAKLDALDTRYRTTLATCTNKTLVTGHAAFGYLAKRYGLHQVGVSGVSPDVEPTPQRLKDVSAYVKKHGVTTVYAETLVSPKTSETIAQQTGATVQVLDPIEGITSASNGKNYLEVMSSNLETLKKGQHCT